MVSFFFFILLKRKKLKYFFFDIYTAGWEEGKERGNWTRMRTRSAHNLIFFCNKQREDGGRERERVGKDKGKRGRGVPWYLNKKKSQLDFSRIVFCCFFFFFTSLMLWSEKKGQKGSNHNQHRATMYSTSPFFFQYQSGIGRVKN